MGRKRQTELGGGGQRKEEFLLLGGVSAAPWPQMDRLRQKEWQGQKASRTRILILPSASCVS